MNISIFPNLSSDLIAIPVYDLVRENLIIELFDRNAKLLKRTSIYGGQTMAYFNSESYYAGIYVVKHLIENLAVMRR